jgi:Heterokaryon incompatibility protein (HET)
LANIGNNTNSTDSGPDTPKFRTPTSAGTSSDEVFQLAMEWIMQCKCAADCPTWYPRRLIDLSELRKRDKLDTRKLISTTHMDEAELETTEVRVVETARWEDEKPYGENFRYVTLSHKWGGSEHNRVQLRNETMELLQSGIKLAELPQTFRDAVVFASRLPHVGYIWIDSLCIKQGDTEDWLTESADMDQVYGGSFLNISATAAEHSDEGLFFPRHPESLLDEEVTLNIDGIPGNIFDDIQRLETPTEEKNLSVSKKSELDGFGSSKITWLFIVILYVLSYVLRLLHLDLRFRLAEWHDTLMNQKRLTTGVSNSSSISQHSRTTRSKRSTKGHPRCTILDVSFWNSRVDEAPVNKRGWVLQERLISPRILHFCYDQIAWECSEFDAAEGRPRGIPNYQLMADGMVQEIRLKGLSPKVNGKELRQLRLRGCREPDNHIIEDIYTFEIWKRIIEAYSRTAITNSQDKLIALSGIAKRIARQIGTDQKPEEYVAGLWRKHLSSQLLWKVDPVYRHVDSTFHNPAKRSDTYRAPTFSWASLDADKGKGIIYGDVTDRDLFIKIDDVQITLKSNENKYGQIDKGHIVLWGKLRKIRLSYKEKERGRFCWRLVDRTKELDDEEHSNVYLDCPNHDKVLDMDNTYCLPAAKGERTEVEESKYIICLLLQAAEGFEDGTFKRIGLTKLSPWGDKLARNLETGILKSYDSDIDLPHRHYDLETGMHQIVLI